MGHHTYNSIKKNIILYVYSKASIYLSLRLVIVILNILHCADFMQLTCIIMECPI